MKQSLSRADAHVPASGRRSVRPGAMLAVLISAFALSHAFRTVPAITAGQIGPEFGVTTRDIGLFAGTFHLAFALMQLPVGIALDRYGPRRTVALLFVVAVLGGALCAVAPSFAALVTGQALLGIGCSPALMGAMVFVGQRYPAERFASLSGVVIAAGSLGMLATATPLAWVVEQWSWRAAFGVLTALSALSALACWLLVEDRRLTSAGNPPSRETLGQAARALIGLVRERQAAGILSLGLVTYAVAITIRGLWVVPLFGVRHGFSLIETGNVVVALSLAMILGPVVFGRIDPGPASRRRLIGASAVATALILGALALVPSPSAGLDIALVLAFGVVSGFYVLQYADVRSSYAPELAGRALAALNMAMFLGVAAFQWLSGIMAEFASAQELDPFPFVLSFLAISLVFGVMAFAVLPTGPALSRTRR